MEFQNKENVVHFSGLLICLLVQDCENYSITNGDVELHEGDTDGGAFAFIHCHDGFELQGDEHIECHSNASWSSYPRCEFTGGCFNNYTVSNGQVNFTNAITPYGGVAYISCNNGYKLTGGLFTKCLDDGVWSTDVTCDVIDCGTNHTVTNGQVSFSDANTTYGRIVYITCNDGYKLTGGVYSECLRDGSWSTDTTCERIDCGTNYTVTNGQVSFSDANTTYGGIVYITCNDGYKLTGGVYTECLRDGSWSTDTTCERIEECTYCCQWPLTADSTEPSKCRVPLFPYGEEAGDSYLPKDDDSCGPITSSLIDIPMYGIAHKNYIVCTNGYVTFNTPFYDWWPPGDISDISDRTLLAPYFGDVDIRGIYGAVYYQAYTSFSNGTSPKLAIQLAEAYVRQLMRNKDFNARFVLVVTWHQAPPYPYHDGWWCWLFGWSCENTKLATFQLVLITDGFDTYLMYIYGDNLMNWRQWSNLWNPDILVGFTIKGGQHYKVHPYSFTTLALDMDQYSGMSGIQGFWMAHLEEPGFHFQNHAVLCLVWYYIVHEEQANPWLQNECPCDLTSLRWDPWFFEISTETSDTVCYDSWTWWLTYPNTIRCCYDKRSGGWISSDPRAGGFLYYDPRTHPTFHQLYDNDTRRYCCDLSDNCDKYRELRPIGSCYVRSLWRSAIFFGDPHISTLDGKRYTFNGLGEYTLLDIQTVNASFLLQGRTERVTNSKGNLTDATIFSAFAAKDNSNASVQVELSADKTEMIIYGNGIDLTDSFRDETSPFSFADPSSKPDIRLSRQNKTLNIFFMSTEMQLSISVGKLMLIQQVTVPEKYKGLTTGLLGNNDGNPDNDFVFANGSLLQSNATERELFPFGYSWMTTQDQSVFEYPPRMNHLDFSFPDFVPMFLDDADDELKQNATQICGAENLECIYDMVMTGSEEIAEDTKVTGLKHTETVNSIENDSPRLNGTRRIEMTHGEETLVLITGFDESALDFFISDDSAAELINATSDSVYVKLHASEAITEEISVHAVDSQGKSSAPHIFEMILCTGCNQHGICNFNRYIEGTSKTDPVKYAICECNGDGNSQFWTGTDCEEDFNGCLSEPCASGQNCTDINATLHQQIGIAFECSACPPGFELNDTKCQAVNMCEDNDHGCEQICEVTIGGYECLCETGFRRRSTNMSACDDVNECEESSHNCQHICINTAGSFNCDCYAGYSLNADGHTCVTEYDACADSAVDCSATAGCTNETGEAKCFCNSGYELDDDGLRCRDNDECLRNVCSQECTNTIGSFVCMCLPGHQLQEDGSTCEACDKVHWGENCQEICECGSGASSCDRVHGCVCDSGWSGDTCSEDLDECLDTNVCGDINKICINTMGSFYCECREGFMEGTDGMCEDINECEDLALNTCEHICNNVIGNFSCSCNTGYVTDSNDPQRCKDLDECVTGISECEQNCKNVPGRYNCYCYYGYVLNDDRRTCSIVQDFCNMTGALNCSHICGIENGEPVCHCPIGYNLAPDKQTCVDINECADPLKNLCSHPDTCYNYNGGYNCSCPVGYRLQNNGRTCVECDAYHYGENCETTCDCLLGTEFCHPVAGCICLDGWTGKHCGEDKNECDAELSPCTGNNTECVSTQGSFECSCKEGFEMVNGVCTDVDECASPRLNNCEQTCTNSIGSFSCQCAGGFILSNGVCEDIEECSGLNDCQQLCSNTMGGYRCLCEAGYRLDVTDGRSCIAETECPEQNKTDCATKNANCIVLNDETVCVCRKGFEDANGNCTDIKECDGTPCDHFCIEDEGSYHCVCQLGYKLGPDQATCQVCDEGTWGDECNQACNCNPETTANCSTETGLCNCQNGWDGNSCTEDINECLDGSASCPENSLCVNVNGSFICKCDTGFTKTNAGVCTECEYGKWGDNCAEDCLCSVDHAVSCNTTDGRCQCMDGWTSGTCSEDIDECLSQDTCNALSESCINTDGSYLCNCKDGFLRNSSLLCEACDVEIYGILCSSDCNCVAENTQTGTTECDPISGFCLCLPQWTGYRCSIDVDECETGAHNCGSNLCNNTAGGFECECEQGFVKGSGGDCVEYTNEQTEDISLIIGLGIGLPAAAIILTAAVALALYYLKGSATPSQITPVHVEQDAAPSYKTDWYQLMLGPSSGHDWNGTSFGNDLPGTTFENDANGTTFGHADPGNTFGNNNPLNMPDELDRSPSQVDCFNPRM